MKVTIFFSFFCFIVLSFSESLTGQTFQSNDADKLVKDSKLVRLNPKNKNVQFIQLRDDAKVEDRDRTIWLGKTLKTSQNHGFREISKSTDKLGHAHSKYQLHYKNLPVEGAIYNIHSSAGRIESANGDYTPGNDVSATHRLSEPLAFEAAIKSVHAKVYRWENEKSARPQGNLVFLPVDDKYVLVYKFDIYALEPLSRQYIFIDATSGVVLKTLNRIHDINIVGTAETMYNGIVSITTDSYLGDFRLRETGRGAGIETYNLKKGTNYNTASDFTDDNNYWNTATNYDKAAYDAHYGSEATYDYYYQKFDRNSYDNNGAKLKSYVHFDSNYVNAFWNGEFMTYGDGDGVNYFPLTSMDIVAHEITHGVTEHSAGLVYADESGALNESFSDIFGVTIDFYKNPSNANYQMGELISASHSAFRDMSNPNVYGNPDTYKGLHWDPYQEVHCNSGVQNFWFYLLCEGGTGTNDIGNPYQINAIGRDKASQIAYRNLTVYLTPNSNYADTRFYSIQAAKDLFGECSVEATTTASAWYAVGIGDANDCLSPENFTAKQTISTQITLNWKKNINRNNVIIAQSTSTIIGNPAEGSIYSTGSPIPGGGVVIYSGDATSTNSTGLVSGTKYYYKAWSVKPGNSYSGGVYTEVIQPTIDAGKDQKIILPLRTAANLSGQYQEGLSIDGIPFKWEKISGKGNVTFDNSTSLITVAHFSEVGKYTLRLTGNYLSIDSMHVVVSLTDSITNHIYNRKDHFWVGVVIKDNYAYLTDMLYGLRIIDISDENNPIEISTYQILYNAHHAHIEGDYIYINHAHDGGLTILNIKDKYNPTFVSYFDVQKTDNSDFIVKNGIVYFTTNPDGLIVIDATNPYNPVRISDFPCKPYNIAIIDNYLYISDYYDSNSYSSFVLDISDPRNLKRLASLPDFYMFTNAIQGEYIYISQKGPGFDDGYRFCIYDISNKLKPKLVGFLEGSIYLYSISVQGNYVYLNDGLRIVDISDKAHPIEVSNEFKYFGEISAQKNTLYCTDDGLVIYKSYLSNRAPYVYAGFDINIDSIPYNLHGEVFDEGLPMGSTISSTWSKVSGSGNVTFSDIHNLNTFISFSDTGRYVIRLTATDGELSANDDVMIYYTPIIVNKQPVNQTICENTQTDFSTEVISKKAISYQWYKGDLLLSDDNNITGTKTNNLTIKNTTMQNAGTYYCLFSNGEIFKSNLADLIVNQIPKLSGTLIGNTTVSKCASNVQYSVSEIDGATSYNWTLPSGATGSSTSNIILISFDNTFTSGIIKVKGHNDCGDGLESSMTITVGLPFTENFESYPFPTTCWTTYSGSNGLGNVYEWRRYHNFEYIFNFNASIFHESVTGGLAEDWLVTPYISIPDGPTFSLNFYEKQTTQTDDGSRYHIKISTTSQTDWATFTDLIAYGETTFGTTYSLRSIDLSAYAGQSVYIAFVMVQNNGDDWFIDNISVDNTPARTNAVWKGTTSTDWNTGSNWVDGKVPTIYSASKKILNILTIN